MHPSRRTKVENQYFSFLPQNFKSTAMHDLFTNYTKIRRFVRTALKQYLVEGQNVRFYSNSSKMSDVEVISLAITAECLAIDSENLLWSKIKKDYKRHFPNLIHRTRYNARRKSLQEWFIYCADKWSEHISSSQDTFIVDSIPVPICKLSRERRSTICRKATDTVKAAKGYNAADSQYFIGYKLHLITCTSGGRLCGGRRCQGRGATVRWMMQFLLLHEVQPSGLHLLPCIVREKPA